jgi:SdpI/YfhL protein family
VPVSVRLAVGALLALAGIALVTVAVLGARRRLRRNRWAGVRTPATMASETQFVAGNRAAAAPVAAAGAVAVAGGAVLLAGAAGALAWVVLAVSLAGVLVLALAGGVVGDRAAAATPAPAPFAAACAGTCAGCDLVAGCRAASGPDHPPADRRD